VVRTRLHLACEPGPRLRLFLVGRLRILVGRVLESFIRHGLVSLRYRGGDSCRQSDSGTADNVPTGEKRLFDCGHESLQIRRNNRPPDLTFPFLAWKRFAISPVGAGSLEERFMSAPCRLAKGDVPVGRPMQCSTRSRRRPSLPRTAFTSFARSSCAAARPARFQSPGGYVGMGKKIPLGPVPQFLRELRAAIWPLPHFYQRAHQDLALESVRPTFGPTHNQSYRAKAFSFLFNYLTRSLSWPR
jgi:hypothetical protein